MGLPEWRVAAVEDLNSPGALEFKVGEGDWPFRGFVVGWEGRYYAYANSCPHARLPLNLTPTGFFNAGQDRLLCSSHGAMFQPADGVCIAGPCVGEHLLALECVERDGEIWVRAPASERQLDLLRTDGQ